MNFKNKCVVVLGGTSGIGLRLGITLAELEADVVAIGRTSRILADHMPLPTKIHSYNVDIRKKEDIQEFFKKFNAGEVDVLINCAGIGLFGQFIEMDINDIEDCMLTNLLGTIIFTQFVAKEMVAKKRGHIVNIESIAAVKGFKYGSIYAASKAGLDMFTKVLWDEVKESNVRISSIKPGLINTQFMHKAGMEDFNLEDALATDDIVRSVIFVLSQSETSNVSDVTLRPFAPKGQKLFHEMLDKSYG